MAAFPRDKTCGDGLTPRAIHELDHLGLGEWVRTHVVNRGLRAAGFGQELLLPWPGGSLPDWGSAVPRSELDHRILQRAVHAGTTHVDGARALDVEYGDGGAVRAVTVRIGKDRRNIECRHLTIPDGAGPPWGRKLGRQRPRDTTDGVALRFYANSPRSDDPWLSSHLELRADQDQLLSGYVWIFPLAA